MFSLLDMCPSEFVKHCWLALLCLWWTGWLPHSPDMLSVNALVGINSDLAHAVLFTYAHALVFRYVSPAATSPQSPIPTPNSSDIQQWFCPRCSVGHAQYKHAGSTHAWPMLASVASQCMPSPCQPLCALHAKLSPAEVHAPCPENIPSHTTQLSTGYTDNYLLIILAPLGGWAKGLGPACTPTFGV